MSQCAASARRGRPGGRAPPRRRAGRPPGPVPRQHERNAGPRRTPQALLLPLSQRRLSQKPSVAAPRRLAKDVRQRRKGTQSHHGQRRGTESHTEPGSPTSSPHRSGPGRRVWSILLPPARDRTEGCSGRPQLPVSRLKSLSPRLSSPTASVRDFSKVSPFKSVHLKLYPSCWIRLLAHLLKRKGQSRKGTERSGKIAVFLRHKS